MKKEEIRLRVQRVLDGSRNAEHLNRIFNWLRFRYRGEATIKEVGDFAAHQDRRDKGVTWKRASDIFHNARLFLSVVESTRVGEPLTISRRQMERSLVASLELIGPSAVHKDTGIGLVRAKRLIASAVQSDPPNWGRLQHRLIDYLTRRFASKPVFTQLDLTTALFKVLAAEGLIKDEEMIDLAAQSDFIAIYVISLMHLCEVDLGDGETGVLEASVASNGTLGIGARMDNVIGEIGMGAPLFETSCEASVWLNGHTDAPWDKIFTIGHPLELGADGRLIELR